MTLPNAQALLRLVQQMQSCMVRYLEPGAYVDREGREWTQHKRHVGLVDDIIHLLDCPEMIEAMGQPTADSGVIEE